MQALGLRLLLFGSACATAPAPRLPDDPPAWPVGPALAPRADGQASLVVYVTLDKLPVRAVDSLAPNYNGGLVRLTSPNAARVIVKGAPAAPSWVVSRFVAASVHALAVDRAGLDRLGLGETGAWIDADTLTFTAAASVGPEWLAELNQDVPIAAFAHRPWIAMKPGVYVPHARDDAPGEHGPGGIGEVFPHPAPTGVARDGSPVQTAEALRASPAAGEALTSAAMVTLRQSQSGRGDSTDLLVLSYDQFGHIVDGFSPDSWETLDALLRLDQSLAALFDHLDRAVGKQRWSVVLSTSPDADGHALWLMWGAGVTPGVTAGDVPVDAAPSAIAAALGLPPT